MAHELCADIYRYMQGESGERYIVRKRVGDGLLIFDKLREMEFVIQASLIEKMCEDEGVVETVELGVPELRGWCVKIFRRLRDNSLIDVALFKPSDGSFYLLDVQGEEELKTFLKDPVEWLRVREPEIFREVVGGCVILDPFF